MIEIQDLTFIYKDEKKPALQDICLTIPEGGFLGVIGPAGAGKTTLARAYLYLYDSEASEDPADGCCPYIAPPLPRHTRSRFQSHLS